MKIAQLAKRKALALSKIIEVLGLSNEIAKSRNKQVQELFSLEAIAGALSHATPLATESEDQEERFTVEEFLGMVAGIEGIGEKTLEKVANGLL